jgi:hypothetical protein
MLRDRWQSERGLRFSGPDFFTILFFELHSVKFKTYHPDDIGSPAPSFKNHAVSDRLTYKVCEAHLYLTLYLLDSCRSTGGA